MQQTSHIVNQVLPILLLLLLGNILRRTNFLPEHAVDALKKIVVNLALPAVLFLSFLEIELKISYFAIFLVIFVLCLALYFLGKFLNPVLGGNRPQFPLMLTGFEYGMLGVSLFGGAYGLDKIGYIAVVDLSHEFFIWFVFVPILIVQRDGAQRPSQFLAMFCKSPVIIGVTLGVVCNLLEFGEGLRSLPVTGAVMSTLTFLAALTIPLILMIVGSGIRIDRRGLGRVLIVTAVRMGLLIPLALLLNAWLIRDLLGLPEPFEIALFTLLILPPPFIAPLFMGPDEDERRYVNNVLTTNTVATIIVFTIYFMMHPTL